MTAGRATNRRQSDDVLRRLLVVDVGHGDKDVLYSTRQRQSVHTLCLCLVHF